MCIPAVQFVWNACGVPGASLEDGGAPILINPNLPQCKCAWAETGVPHKDIMIFTCARYYASSLLSLWYVSVCCLCSSLLSRLLLIIVGIVLINVLQKSGYYSTMFCLSHIMLCCYQSKWLHFNGALRLRGPIQGRRWDCCLCKKEIKVQTPSIYQTKETTVISSARIDVLLPQVVK